MTWSGRQGCRATMQLLQLLQEHLGLLLLLLQEQVVVLVGLQVAQALPPLVQLRLPLLLVVVVVVLPLLLPARMLLLLVVVVRQAVLQTADCAAAEFPAAREGMRRQIFGLPG
jgi:hypothetical protein